MVRSPTCVHRYYVGSGPARTGVIGENSGTIVALSFRRFSGQVVAVGKPSPAAQRICHSRKVWSWLPEASVRPSGENATDRTRSVWPVRGRSRGVGRVRSATLHSRTVVSAPLEASVRPSGENATARGESSGVGYQDGPA
ncbi:hypothetical protein FAGKG844_960009 [Frankia sp. AgKG'84/4]